MVDLERSTQLTSGPELRDVAANRSEYEPKAGLHYNATDTGAEFIGDGNRWNKIQSTGANPSFRSVDTEEASIEDSNASYRIKTDGSTIVAVPQRSSLAKVQDTDIGPLLEEVIINQLPPSGSLVEARGRVEFTGGAFPGDLSNGTYDGIPLPSQCRLIGEVSSHDQPNATKSTIPTTERPTSLEFSSRAIFSSNSTSDQLVWPAIWNLQLVGPGWDVAGSFGIDGTGQTNTWDYLELRNVNVQDCETPIDLPNPGEQRVVGCKFERYTGDPVIRDRTFVHHTTFSPSNDGGTVKFNDSTVTACEFDGIGEAEPFVQLGGEAQFGYGTKIRKSGGATGSGTAVSLEGDGVVMNGVRFKESPNGETWAQCINAYVPVGARVVNCLDATTSTNSITINGGGGAAELVLANNNLANGVNYLNSPKRVMRNGRSFTTSASPGSGTSQWDGSEVLAYEQGVTVEDRSVTTPYSQYVADSAGNWVQVG